MADDKGDRKELNSLSDLFDKGFNAVSQIECSTESGNSKNYQSSVQTAIKSLEDATRLVNQMGMFSDNEDLDEVATADLKYLLLPALLGYAVSRSATGGRAEALASAEVYYGDFLERCRRYGVAGPEGGTPRESRDGDELERLLCAARRRQRKIRRYRQREEMRERRKLLEETVGKGGVDDEVAREYYTVLLRFWVNEALEELGSIEEEKPILQHMASLKGKRPSSPVPQKPLRPVVLTRNELQKKVYGAGYPGLPTLTVEEFYAGRYTQNEEQEAAKPCSLQRWAADPDAAAREEEEEEAQREAELDADDPGALAYLRSRDEWKDENRRGCGNRKNMG